MKQTLTLKFAFLLKLELWIMLCGTFQIMIWSTLKAITYKDHKEQVKSDATGMAVSCKERPAPDIKPFIFHGEMFISSFYISVGETCEVIQVLYVITGHDIHYLLITKCLCLCTSAGTHGFISKSSAYFVYLWQTKIRYDLLKHHLLSINARICKVCNKELSSSLFCPLKVSDTTEDSSCFFVIPINQIISSILIVFQTPFTTLQVYKPNQLSRSPFKNANKWIMCNRLDHIMNPA